MSYFCESMFRLVLHVCWQCHSRLDGQWRLLLWLQEKAAQVAARANIVNIFIIIITISIVIVVIFNAILSSCKHCQHYLHHRRSHSHRHYCHRCCIQCHHLLVQTLSTLCSSSSQSLSSSHLSNQCRHHWPPFKWHSYCFINFSLISCPKNTFSDCFSQRTLLWGKNWLATWPHMVDNILAKINIQ